MKYTVQQIRDLLQPFTGLKGRFPFRLGTTSYIYPGEIVPNVEILGDFLDEIQLLLFEGKSYSNIPDGATIRHLKRLAKSKNISYSIHLPLDAYPGDEEEEVRRDSVAMITRIHEVGIALGCTRFIFHYASRRNDGKPLGNFKNWRAQLCKSTEELLSAGINPKTLCVENLAYPFSWVSDLVQNYRLTRCIDIGHLRVNRFRVKPHLDKYLKQTKVIHLHGLKNGRDHHGLSLQDQRTTLYLFEVIQRIRYNETLILEIFQPDHLVESLGTFQHLWKKWQRKKLYS